MFDLLRKKLSFFTNKLAKKTEAKLEKEAKPAPKPAPESGFIEPEKWLEKEPEKPIETLEVPPKKPGAREPGKPAEAPKPKPAIEKLAPGAGAKPVPERKPAEKKVEPEQPKPKRAFSLKGYIKKVKKSLEKERAEEVPAKKTEPAKKPLEEKIARVEEALEKKKEEREEKPEKKKAREEEAKPEKPAPKPEPPEEKPKPPVEEPAPKPKPPEEKLEPKEEAEPGEEGFKLGKISDLVEEAAAERPPSLPPAEKPPVAPPAMEPSEERPAIPPEKPPKLEPAPTPKTRVPEPEPFPRPEAPAQAPEEKRELKAKLGAFGAIKGVLKGHTELKEGDVADLLFELELSLLEADVNHETAIAFVSRIKELLLKEKIPRGTQLNEFLKEKIRQALAEMTETKQINIFELISQSKKPFKILFLGPNGAGKTTTIAKLTHAFKAMEKSVIWAAADTFRAASIEQLEEHARKLGIRVVKHGYGADPTAVAFDAVKAAEAKKIDVVMIDSAGRQETNKNLIDELKKMERVIKPDLKIFIGEAFAGKNLIEQARAFDEAVNIDGFILSKIDTDAKGGTILSLLHELKKPVLFIGTGQGYKDLIKFTPQFIIDRIV